MPTRGKYDPANDFGAQTRVLGLLLERALRHTQHLDTQLNILIGFSMALFAFAASHIDRAAPSIAFIFLAGFTGLASIIALIGVHPGRLFRSDASKQRDQKSSVLYHRGLTAVPLSVATKRIASLLTPAKLAEEVAQEVYNSYKYYYLPKRRYYYVARAFLVSGIIAAITAALTERLAGPLA